MSPVQMGGDGGDDRDAGPGVLRGSVLLLLLLLMLLNVCLLYI